jgi:UDP-GlcNAc:undecaprenyl-phosphate GlcNAc-1-phosphate transferase
MPIDYIFIFIAATLLAIIFIAIFRKFSDKLDILRAKGISVVGGLSIWFAFFIAYMLGFIFYGDMPFWIKSVFFAGAIMLFFGMLDDIMELPVFTKFLIQFLAATVLIFCGTRTNIVYIGDILNIVITYIWLIGITNAFNHLDVIDGAAAGAGLFAGLSFLVISLASGNIALAILMLALCGAILGFLCYNFPPAKVYLGNCGSHFLGFLLAAVAINISYASLDRKTALLAPIVILGVPIYDTLFVMWVRAVKGRSVMAKSDDHFSLVLLDKGYTKRQVAALLYLFCAVFSIAGLSLSHLPDSINFIILSSLAAASILIARTVGRFCFSKQHS